MAKAIKVFISLVTSKDGRKLLATSFIIAVSPLILIILVIVSIADGASKHNNHLIETLFHDAKVSDKTPIEYQNLIRKYQLIFNEIDLKVASLKNVEESLDRTLIKSMLLTFFINNDNDDYILDLDKYLQNFYTIESKVDITDENNIENVDYLIPIQDSNKLLANVSNFLEYDLLDKQSQVNEIYNVALTGSSQDLEQYIPMQSLLKDFYKASENTAYIGGPFLSPFEDDWRKHVTSEFGSRFPIKLPDGSTTSEYHTGIDLANALNTPIQAVASGKVIAVKYTNIGLGFYVVIDHGGGIFTVYGHMARIYVKENQTVKAGDKVGEVGSTGYSTGPHLHLEVIENRQRINPRKHLP